jgi:hypothetical protein
LGVLDDGAVVTDSVHREVVRLVVGGTMEGPEGHLAFHVGLKDTKEMKELFSMAIWEMYGGRG